MDATTESAALEVNGGEDSDRRSLTLREWSDLGLKLDTKEDEGDEEETDSILDSSRDTIVPPDAPLAKVQKEIKELRKKVAKNENKAETRHTLVYGTAKACCAKLETTNNRIAAMESMMSELQQVQEGKRYNALMEQAAIELDKERKKVEEEKALCHQKDLTIKELNKICEDRTSRIKDLETEKAQQYQAAIKAVNDMKTRMEEERKLWAVEKAKLEEELAKKKVEERKFSTNSAAEKLERALHPQDKTEKRKIQEDQAPSTDRSKVKRQEKFKVGHLGDSNLKIITINQDIEATIWKNESESLLRYEGGLLIKNMQKIPSKVFDKADGMLIAGGGRELHYGFSETSRHHWRELSPREQEDRVNRVADEVHDLVEKYRKQGKKVVYYAPHLRKYSNDDQEARLVKACRNRFHEEVTIIDIPADQMNEFEATEDREDTLERNLKSDGTHMEENMSTFFYREAVNEFGWCLEPEGSGKETVKFYLKQAAQKVFHNRCTRCGSTSCRSRTCNTKVYCNDCKRNHHDTRVCPSQVRPCFHCGDNGPHQRRPCEQAW